MYSVTDNRSGGQHEYFFSYEDITTTIIVDSSATVCVINESQYFIDNLEPAPHTYVATILERILKSPWKKLLIA
jgi:hypothetical protein